MTVWIRIALYVVAGWLYGSGYSIGEEVKSMITDDPAVAASIEAGIAAVIGAIPVAWWQWARKMGASDVIAALFATIWSRITGWLAPVGMALAIVAGAFFYGRSSGKADAKAEQAKANAKAIKQARAVEDDVQNMGAAMLIALSVSGCVTAGSYRDVARPVRPSVEDKMTEGTKRQILAENEKLAKLCGVKP